MLHFPHYKRLEVRPIHSNSQEDSAVSRVPGRLVRDRFCTACGNCCSQDNIEVSPGLNYLDSLL